MSENDLLLFNYVVQSLVRANKDRKHFNFLINDQNFPGASFVKLVNPEEISEYKKY